MGSREAKCYLASPAAVAASAIAGYLTLPEPSSTQSISATITINPPPDRSVESVTLFKDFPSIIEGTLVFCPQDNLNTDGIFPGKYTYLDDFSPEDQARVVMENYDPEFTKIVRKGDLLVGGFNFGTGSSREQAATALKYRGIRAVIAGSFSQTYKRNAFNNGFLVGEAPQLVTALQNEISPTKPTIRTTLRAQLDFAQSTITVSSKTYPMAPLGLSAQEIILTGGLETWVRRKIK
jgi:homoaconitate hydratase